MLIFKSKKKKSTEGNYYGSYRNREFWNPIFRSMTMRSILSRTADLSYGKIHIL